MMVGFENTMSFGTTGLVMYFDLPEAGNRPILGNPRQSWILDSTPWIPDYRYWIPVFVNETWILESNV